MYPYFKSTSLQVKTNTSITGPPWDSCKTDIPILGPLSTIKTGCSQQWDHLRRGHWTPKHSCLQDCYLTQRLVCFKGMVSVEDVCHGMVPYCVVYVGAGITCWQECQTHDQKVASSNPSSSGWGIFFSRVNFVCWLLFSVHSSPLLLQWHIKDLSHSATSVDGRLYLNMHTALTQRSQTGLCFCPGIVWEPIWKWAHTQLVGESSQLDEPLWTDPGLEWN